MAASRLSKGPITPILKRFRWFPLATTEKYGGSFLKNAWCEAPNLVVSLTASSIAIGCLIYRFQEDQKNPRFKDKPFKRFYTVYRPDDPRIENLKARPDYYNPEGTIPDIQDTKPMYEGWKGPKGDPVMADGRYAGDISPRLSMPKTEYHPDHAPK